MTNASIKVRRSKKTKKSITEKYMMVESTSELVYDTFDKQIIINSLIKECELKENDALIIANKVEAILIKSDLKTVTSSFIRSLTNQILSENNPDKWLKYSALTIPLYDAKRMIEDRNVENSNACFSTASINATMGEQIHKQLAIREYFNKKSAEAHKKGELHLHDAGKFSSPYCSGNSIEYLKKYGLRLPEISPSLPAAHANTLVNHMQCFASFLRTQFNGAIGFADVNIAFAPFLVDRSYEEIKQIAQHLIFSFAQLASGSDICFSDFNLYLNVPRHIAESNAIGPKGKPTGKKYKEYEKEAKLFLKALLEVAMVGDADGGNFRFPKLDVHIDAKSFEPENDELMNLICELNSKRGSAYILYDRGNTVKISECPVSGDETVLILDNGKSEVKKIKTLTENNIYTIYGIDKFVKGKFNKYLNQDMFEIVLSNNKKVKTSKNHINLCYMLRNGEYQEIVVNTETLKELHDNKKDLRLPINETIGGFTGDIKISKNLCAKIKAIKDLQKQETAYCFAVLNDTPYFTLMNSGVLTHNCRLSLEITGEELERMIAHPEEARFSALQNCTLNLPRIAYKSKDMENVKKEIDRLVKLAIDAHKDKFNHLQNVLKVKDGALKFLASGMDGKPYLRMDEAKFLIGMCGLNEMVKIISGYNLHDNEEALKLGLEIIAYLNLSMERQAKENNMNCILEETPAESTAGRFAALDLKYYYDKAKNYVNGNIEKGEVYYTNSVHLAYNANVDILTRIEKQSKFASMIKAGSIIHNWFGENEPDPKALKELYKITLFNTNAVQTADSPDMTVCKDCHNTFKGLKDVCPSCGSSNIYNTTRITGYFSQISGWTKSKLAELKDRTKVDFSMAQFENTELNNNEEILFFQKPNCEKCETVKKQLKDKLNENIKILDTHDYKGLAMASYYNVDELPCLMKVKGSQIISKLSGAGSYLKWLKDNVK